MRASTTYRLFYSRVLLPHTRIITLTSRQFHTARLLAQSNVQISEDPDQPGVYYYRTTSDGHQRIFFGLLKDIPESALRIPAQHPGLFGWIEAEKGVPIEEAIKPDNFQENKVFRDTLNEVLRKDAHVVDPTLEALATRQSEGWLHIIDERTAPTWGRVPDPEDIFGSVEVRNGQIIPNSFQPMPAHRLISSYGIFKLSHPLHLALIERIQELAASSSEAKTTKSNA